MTIQPNGTDAKDIAMHFLKLTSGNMDGSNIAKTIIHAKLLLKNGYSKPQIIQVIDYLCSKKTNIYSLGYVAVSIADTLETIKKNELLKKLQQEINTQENSLPKKEVEINADDSKRNNSKLNNFGTKPRFGEKLNFDLFEE